MVKASITKTSIIVNFNDYKKFLALKNNLRIQIILASKIRKSGKEFQI
jgi:hypothetical protein